MTHILMAFTSDGELIAAKPVLCKDEGEDLEREKTRFQKDYVDEEIGDTFGFITEDDVNTITNMNDGEVHETGV